MASQLFFYCQGAMWPWCYTKSWLIGDKVQLVNPLEVNPTKWSNTLKQLVTNSSWIVCACLTMLWDRRLKVFKLGNENRNIKIIALYLVNYCWNFLNLYLEFSRGIFRNLRFYRNSLIFTKRDSHIFEITQNLVFCQKFSYLSKIRVNKKRNTY